MIIGGSWEEATLSDGTSGYKYTMLPIPYDAILTMNIRFLGGYQGKAYVYTINLSDFN